MSDLPRVTEIIKSAGLMPDFSFNDEARDRGTFIHQATVIDEQGDLDESFEPTIRFMPYILAWRKFRAEHECRWTRVEEKMQHDIFKYCGTPDRAGQVDAKFCVVDIKSGAAAKWHKIQLAAYQAMIPNSHGYDRLIVRLQDDGNYAVDWFGALTYQADLNVFLSALTLYNFKKIEGLNGNGAY